MIISFFQCAFFFPSPWAFCLWGFCSNFFAYLKIWENLKLSIFFQFLELPCSSFRSHFVTLLNVLLQWALMTAIDPAHSLANLIYIGYGRDPSSALSVTRRRSVDRKKQRTERNVFQCFVFGPKKSGKSALLDSFLGRC